MLSMTGASAARCCELYVIPKTLYSRFNKMIVRKPGAFGGLDCVDFHVEERDLG